MRIIFYFLMIVLTININANQSNEKQFDCLPEGIKLKDFVMYDKKNNPIYVVNILNELNAKCEKGILKDKNNKEIKFFQYICNGGPYTKAQMEKDKKLAEEVEQCKKTCTVVELQCQFILK